MKPKAKKFRIRRSTVIPGTPPAKATAVSQDTAGAPSAVAPQRARPTNPKPVQPRPKAPEQPAAAPPVMQGDVASAQQVAGETDIDTIRREGLTGRQLRMARRVAHKHNLPATSDFDAVRLLRQSGIDPFKRSNMLELVVPQGGAEQHEGGAPDALANVPAQTTKVQLPQTIPAQKQTLPSTELSPVERRTQEIGDIQRDITRRRRRRMGLLFARLSFFVFLPTLIAGWYFNVAATPMYSTKSEFLILKADSAGGSGIGGLLTGTQFATNQDSIAVQSFLQSKDAMLRLDKAMGYKAHFTQESIDPIQRLEDNPSNEDAYKLYKKNVKIGYDPTEGVIKMEVIAADPKVASEISSQLITFAENRVNHLSEQKRGDQMTDAKKSFMTAQDERRKAQEALVQLQLKGAILDPEGVISSLRGQINNVEIQVQEKELQLAALMDNARPNKAKVDGARADIRRYKNLLQALNDKMTDASQGENSLAKLTVNIQMAQADLTTRDMLLQSALQQVEQTRMEANRQVRYLTTSVEPVPSQEPSYPRKFENTILAFLVFGGIYLMISLTASILREQVTS
ncbi:MAG: capsular polysaccharide transport system permease protein [Paracoccaceae bacterium]|jgi:capsular polysaccharide transport system permease protein